MIHDLKSIRDLEKYFKKINAEEVYFHEYEGRKTFELVMDIPKGSKITEIIEPMFEKFEARVMFQPVKTLDELKKSVSKKK